MLKEYISSGENLAASVMAGVVGVVPLALLAYKGVNSINAAAPLINPIRQDTSSTLMGDALGKAAREKAKEQEKRIVARTEAIRKKFTEGTPKSNWMDRIKRSADARARNLQAFASFLDDPNLDLTDIQKGKLKTLIGEAALNESMDIEPLWDEVIEPLVKQNNTELLGEFERVRRNYSKAGQLVPASKTVVDQSPLQSVRFDEDSSAAGKMLGRVRQKLGNSYSVEGHLVQIGDTTVPIARVYSRGKRGLAYEATMPLSGETLFAAGEHFQTIKSAPKYVVDYRHAANLVRGVDTLNQLVARGGAVGMDEYSLNLLDEFRQENGRYDMRRFRQTQDEVLTGVSRGISNDSDLAKHIAHQAGTKGNRVATVGLGTTSTENAIRFQIDLAKVDGIDPAGAGEKNILEGFGQGRKGTLGIANHRGGRKGPATIATVFSNTFKLPKHSISLGLRESQLVGRDKMSTEGNVMVGVNKNIPLGAVTNRTDIFPHSEVMGTSNARMGLIVWNENTAAFKDSNKQGNAYSGRRFKMRESMTPTVIDSERMGLPYENKFINDLKKAGSITLTADQLKNPIYLGEQADGNPYIFTPSPDTRSATFKLQNAPNVAISKGEKPLLQLVVEVDRELNMAKLFSAIHKGNAIYKDPALIEEYVRRDFGTGLDDMMKHLNVSFGDLLVGNSNMVEKDTVLHQLIMTQQAIAGSKNSLTVQDIMKRAAKLDGEISSGKYTQLIDDMVGTHTFKPEVKASRTRLAKHAITILTSMKGSDPALIGNVLCGLNFGTGSDIIKADKSVTRNDRLEKAGLEKLIDFVITDPKGRLAARDGMELGASLVPDISAFGEGIYDYNKSTASMEPRAAVAIFERLKVAGISTDDALQVVTSLHEGQKNFLPMFKIATGLNPIVQSMHGLYGPMEFIDDTRNGIKRLTLDELKAGVVKSEGDVVAFLRSFKGGAVLDMGSAPDAVRSTFKEVYGGTEIRLPGADLFDAMKGTKVKVSANSPNIDIDNAVAVQLKSLTESLFSSGTDIDRLRERLTNVREEMDGLLTKSMTGITKGKVRGSKSPIAGFMSLDDSSIDALPSQRKKIEWGRKLFKKTTGRVAFYDHHAFLSQIADSKGVMDLNRRAQMAESFFMGGEWHDPRAARGVAIFAGRDPILTSGNFSMLDVFRNPNEIARLGGDDEFFRQFAGSKKGRSILDRYFTPAKAGSMQNFGDLMTAFGTGPKAASRRHKFFKEFVGNLESFYGFDSSGTMSAPVWRDKAGQDVGFGAAAFLDYDGDHLKTFMLSKQEQAIFRRAVGDKGYQQSDVLFRIFMQKMGDQSKKALKNIAVKMGENGDSFIDDEIRKGITIAIRTGPLDVSLQRLHNAMFDYAGDNMEDAMFNRGILGAVLETFALKSKKLPRATDYPQEFERVSKELMDNPNDESAAAFKRLISEAYEGTDFGGNGFTVDLSGVADVDPRFAAKLGNKSKTFSAEQWTDYVIGAARSAYANGTSASTSEGARRALLSSSPEEFRQIFDTGTDVASAAMRAFTDEAGIAAKASYATSAMRQNILGLDRMATGKLALALGAGAVLSGLVGMSHSSSPMIDPNEALPAASVRDAIAQNNLFTGGSDEIPRDYPTAEVGYGSQNIAYLERPNTYQIKGRVGSQGALQSISGDYRMMTGGAGRGSVVVNDRRMPITSNYIDRLLGEY